MKKLLFIIIIAAGLSSCATMFTGARQTVVFSAPEGTEIYRDNVKIAEIPPTYDAVSVRVKKSLAGAALVAKNPGYQDTYFYLNARLNGLVFLNLLQGPFFPIGGIVDVSTGAAVKFPGYVEINMVPLGPLTAPPARDTSLDYLLKL